VFNDGVRSYIQWLALPTDLPSVVIPKPNKTSFAELGNSNPNNRTPVSVGRLLLARRRYSLTIRISHNTF